MVRILRVLDKNTDYDIKSKDFLPLTYTWDVSKSKVTADEKALFEYKHDGKHRWIVKNPVGMGGKGIKIIDNLENYAK